MKRRWLGLLLAFIVGAGVMALVAVAAGLWNGTKYPVILNTDKVERAIESSIQTQRHLDSTVSCPVNIIQRAGVTFICQASVQGHLFPVDVTEVDGNGHVTYVVM